MTTTRLALALLLAAATACGSRVNNDGPHRTGATAFTSQPPGGSRGGVADGGEATPTGAPGPTAPGAAAGGATGGATRTLEEADIYRLSGKTLFVLNAFRGLQVIDLADLASPRLVGRVPALGTPVDLYVRGTTAFVLLSDAFAYLPAADGSTRPQRGSRLLAVDVADPAAPRVTGELLLDGQVEESRLVGDVLYVVSRRWWWWEWIGPVSVGAQDGAALPLPLGAGGTDTVFVASFDVADPARPAPVDRLELPAAGWDVHANVTPERITLSFAGWAADPLGGYGPRTNFQAVDISDPAGHLAAGAAFTTPGTVRDRWGMDFDAGTGLFRAIVDLGWNGGAALQHWSSPAPGEAKPGARLEIVLPESLTAARFDGARVYLVTAARIDPLWTIDGSDPAHPVIAGQVVMPGQLDFIEPRGDRLVALGHTNEAGQPWQLAASLFDVADLAAPRLLSRVPFGAGTGWVGTAADDLRKAFLVFDPPPAGIGLVLVPVQGWDPASWSYTGGTQLIDLGRDALTLRGFLGHPGAVARAFPADAAGARLVALSDQALQTIDAAD
ncbi:MAG TPA: beta-propeller domain-containing protein, partial [Anaeromyxobacteraceae bacterium]